MTSPKIITSHVYPPIPSRKFDWCAYIEGLEEEARFYGWGASELDALKELGAIIEDYADDRVHLEFPGVLSEIELRITALLPAEGQP